jgi:hypothetical protein
MQNIYIYTCIIYLINILFFLQNKIHNMKIMFIIKQYSTLLNRQVNN